MLDIVLDEFVSAEGHSALLGDGGGLALGVESSELGVVNLLGLLHAAESGADITIVSEEVVVPEGSALDSREVIDKGHDGE